MSKDEAIKFMDEVALEAFNPYIDMITFREALSIIKIELNKKGA